MTIATNSMIVAHKYNNNSYILIYNDEEIILYESVAYKLLYAECPKCKHIDYFKGFDKNEFEVWIDEASLIMFIKHIYSCDGVLSSELWELTWPDKRLPILYDI